jgi:nucleotide-binding universal stress UspA family protein
MKILVAYDGSECSDAAIVNLRRAGLPTVAEVLILSVAEISTQIVAVPYGAPVAGTGMFFPESLESETSSDHQLREAQAFAAQAVDRLQTDFPGWRINTEAWVDAAGSAIIRKAHAWKPDLIVVGSHGSSGFSRIVLGSVSEKVLHHVTGSVRISRHRLHPQERSVRLLIGIDGSTGAKAALQAIATRNWPPGTEVRVVGVKDCGSLRANTLTATPEAVPMAMEEKWRSQLSTTIHEAVHELTKSGLLATPQVLAGKPGQVLLAEAEKWAVDCVFVGARGLNGLERILLGSVSTVVASHAHCSVEIVRPQGQ